MKLNEFILQFGSINHVTIFLLPHEFASTDNEKEDIIREWKIENNFFGSSCRFTGLAASFLPSSVSVNAQGLKTKR